MRTVKAGRLLVLSLLLATAALLASSPGSRGRSVAKAPLQQAFSRFGGWMGLANSPMDEKVVEALNLDDYLFRSYRRGNGEVSLYIGYYRSAAKVGAAHDPLVCFQGQGWKIEKRDQGSYTLVHRPAMTVSYSSMVAERQDERELIVYWFQVNGKAMATTHAQKGAMLWEKLTGRGEENAFVRLSVPLGTGSVEQARTRIFEFVEDFYPDFHRYVTS